MDTNLMLESILLYLVVAVAAFLSGREMLRLFRGDDPTFPGKGSWTETPPRIRDEVEVSADYVTAASPDWPRAEGIFVDPEHGPCSAHEFGLGEHACRNFGEWADMVLEYEKWLDEPARPKTVSRYQIDTMGLEVARLLKSEFPYWDVLYAYYELPEDIGPCRPPVVITEQDDEEEMTPEQFLQDRYLVIDGYDNLYNRFCARNGGSVWFDVEDLPFGPELNGKLANWLVEYDAQFFKYYDPDDYEQWLPVAQKGMEVAMEIKAAHPDWTIIYNDEASRCRLPVDPKHPLPIGRYRPDASS